MCIVTSWFPNKKRPYLAPYVYQFARNLESMGLDVSVITTLTKGDKYYDDSSDLKIYRICRRFPYFSMAKIIDKINPDLIHIHSPNQFSVFSFAIGKIKTIPVVATVHRAEIDTTNIILSTIRKIILSRCNNVVAVSEYTKILAIRAGIKSSAISVIHNSCNEALFVAQSKLPNISTRDIPENKKKILFVGNIIRIKGIYLLIEVLSILRKRIDFHAIIIGTGEDEKIIKKSVDDLNLSKNVSFVGWIPQEELYQYYNAADVFVLPSYTEGNSVAILEAMFMGIPIIASKAGGNPESIIDGVNGYLVAAGDIIGFSERIEEILKDTDLQIFMSENCKRIYAERFSNKKQIDKYLHLYRNILALRSVEKNRTS